jgi:hypothetical protein
MRRSAVIRLGAVVVVVGALTAACGGGGGDSKAVDAGSARTTTTTGASAPTGATGSASGAGTTCRLAAGGPTSTPASTSVALLTDLRAAVHEGCDRIVFQFRDGAVPGYSVEYKAGPFNKGESDEALEVQGHNYLVIRFDKAAGADLASPNALPTYTGPRSITNTGLTHVVEVVNSEDFEGILTWVVGLDSQRSFTVNTLSSPPRVVIDLS